MDQTHRYGCYLVAPVIAFLRGPTAKSSFCKLTNDYCVTRCSDVNNYCFGIIFVHYSPLKCIEDRDEGGWWRHCCTQCEPGC